MAEKIIVADVVKELTDVQACILWISLLFPGVNTVNFLRVMMSLLFSSRAIDARQIRDNCELLVSKGIMKCLKHHSKTDSGSYMLSARLDAHGLVELRNRAVKYHWMPTKTMTNEAAHACARIGSPEYERRYGMPNQLHARSIVIRALIGCAPTVGADELFISSDMAFDGAATLTGKLSQGVCLLENELSGPTDVRLLGGAVSAFFCCGRDVGSLLNVIRDAAKDDKVEYPAIVVLTYGALRIWRGENPAKEHIGSWVEAGDALRLPDLDKVFNMLASAEWEAAQNALSTIVASRVLAGGNAILIPFLVLAYAVAIRCGEQDAKIRKICSLIKKSIPPKMQSDYWETEEVRDKVVNWANRLLSSICKGPISATTDDNRVWLMMSDFVPAVGSIPLAFALRVPRLMDAVDDRIEKSACQHVAQQAVHACRNGYPLLAGIFLSGTPGHSYSSPDIDEAMDMFSKSGAHSLLPEYDPSNEWKSLVLELEKIVNVGKKENDEKKSTKSRAGTLVWGLVFDDCIYYDSYTSDSMPKVCNCVDIVPCFRGPRAPTDGSKDKQMTLKGVTGKLYVNIITEQDRAVIDKLKEHGYGRVAMREVPSDAIEALLNHPHIVQTFPNYYGVPRAFPHAISFTRLSWNVTSAPTGDGGLELCLPSYVREAVDFPRIVRFDLDDFRFLKLSDRERQFVSGFFAIAPDGRITLPSAAMTSISPVLTAMAKVVPMEGDFAALGEQPELERLNGDPIPTARLEMHGDALNVSLCVKPLSKNPTLVLKPGVGSPERMIRDGKETKVLVRDLSAEKEASSKVVKALAEFDGWMNDDWVWNIDDLADSLSVLATLKDLGEEIVRMEWREGARLSVSTAVKCAGGLNSQGGADRWFRVDGTFEVDENVTMSLLQLLKACRGRVGRFIPLGDRAYARLSAELVKRLEALGAAGREQKDGLAVSAAALPMLDGVFSDKDGELALPRKMRIEAENVRSALAAEHPVPDRLKAELRPYQEEGYVWLSRLCACGYGACLADDMGLGKTVQLIALLLARAKDGASLVVAPTSVCSNWRHEIERFAPTLHCLCTWEIDDEEWQKAGPHDVVITSYGLLVSREKKFANCEWNGIVLDEAQAIKNEGTERARAVKTLKARFRVAATGTPIENRLTELWSIFDFINSGLLGTSAEFIAKLTSEGRATTALKSLVRPLILRRLKREVLQDLPEKTEITLSVPLEGAERAGYEACRLKAIQTLEDGGKDNRISILAELTRLRRYCCHPSLVLPEQSESAKMEALVDLLRDLKGANHRVLVFSQFTDYLAIVEARLRAEGISYQYLDGATPPKERERRVSEFQRGEGDVFLMSLKAGGTGLNLTAANYVVLLDPWWNPAVEDQAADRVHRIGQRQPVTVYRLVAADTVEERVLELHAEKKQLATDILEGTASSALTPEALMGLFG